MSPTQIIKNEPYESPTGEKGQYTHKLYHIGSHLPAWLRSILPKTALVVHEESWNAYPYTRTKYATPFLEKFVLDVETRFYNDDGSQENVFGLSKKEREEIEVDFLDILTDEFDEKKYKKEEDPASFVSQKTGRGPLKKGWQKTMQPMMCAYKLCRVECKWWGLQGKIERFIHRAAIRNVLVLAHRQAWCWQDEYMGLTLDQIRAMERETMAKLMREMAVAEADEEGAAEGAAPAPASAAATSTSATVSARASSAALTTAPHTTTHDGDRLAPPSLSDAPGKGSGSSASLRRRSSVQLAVLRSEEERVLALTAVSLEQLAVAEDESSAESEEDEFHDAVSDQEEEEEEGGASTRLEGAAAPTAARGGEEEEEEEEFEVVEAAQGDSSHGGASGADAPLGLHEHEIFVVLHGDSVLASSKASGAAHDDFLIFRQSITKAARSSPSLHVLSLELPALCADAAAAMAALQPHTSSTSYPLAAVAAMALADPKLAKSLPEVAARLEALVREHIAARALDAATVRVHIVGDASGGVVAYDLVSDARVRLGVDVHSVFVLGCPLGLVLAHRQAQASAAGTPAAPRCAHLYNVFQQADPLAFRVEPLLVGAGGAHAGIQAVHVADARLGTLYPAPADVSTWWGTQRVDYELESPLSALGSLPVVSMAHLMYASYWESKEVAAFIASRILRKAQHAVGGEEYDIPPFAVQLPAREPRKTRKRMKNMAPDHRAADVVCKVGDPQVLAAKFSYGPLSLMHLPKDEEVAVYVLNERKEWTLLDVVTGAKHGRMQYTIPREKQLPIGMHPFKFVVLADRSVCEGWLLVSPPRGLKCVVFSIYGALCESVLNVSATKMRIRPSAPDAVRYWSSRGYAIVYVTGRPDMQRSDTLNWLARHNFPLGITWFADSLRSPSEAEARKHEFLTYLKNSCGIEFAAGYGASRDLEVFQALGIDAAHSFILGKKKQDGACTHVAVGYSQHVADLRRMYGSDKAGGAVDALSLTSAPTMSRYGDKTDA